MKLNNSLNRKTSHLILAGIFSLTLSACGGSSPATDTTGTSQIVSSIDLPDDGSGIAVAGSYAYVAANNSGLQVIDVSNKSAPVIVAEQNTIKAFGGVQYVDTGAAQRVYMSGYQEGLNIVGVDDPTAPTLPITKVTLGLAVDVAIDASGGFSCVADGLEGVAIFNDGLSQKNVVTLESVAGVAKSGNYCFATAGTTIAGGVARLYVIDVTKTPPFNIEATLSFIGSPTGIVIAGDYAYIATGDPGMYVINISDPLTPAVVGQTGALPATGSIAVDATRMRAYLGTVDTVGFLEDGLKIIDITNAASPAVIATVDLPDRTAGVFALDGFVYATTVADFGTTVTSQFHIVDVSAF